LIVTQANTVRSQWAELHHQRTLEQQRAAASTLNIGQQSPPRQSPASGDEMMEKLKQLGEMKTAGLLTDEEFSAAKTKLLGL
jgi:hypothetical protein